MGSHLYKQVHELLMGAKRPVFISDERIDGDSLGASLAMADFLRQERGLAVPVHVSGKLPRKYRAMPGAGQCTPDASVLEDPAVDLIVVFDCSDEAYVRELVARGPGAPIVVNIDHHATNPGYGDLNVVVPESPATAEVVYRFFQENGIRPSREAATCMLTGICFDTTLLSNSAANPRAFEAASDLIFLGARVQGVVRTLFENRSVPALRLWGAALSRLRRHPRLGIVTTCLTRDDLRAASATDEDADGLSDFLNLTINEDTLMIARETDAGVKVSMRTRSGNVARLARAMGGGGHVKAAGFTVPGARLKVLPDGTCKAVAAIDS